MDTDADDEYDVITAIFIAMITIVTMTTPMSIILKTVALTTIALMLVTKINAVQLITM